MNFSALKWGEGNGFTSAWPIIQVAVSLMAQNAQKLLREQTKTMNGKPYKKPPTFLNDVPCIKDIFIYLYI